MYSKPFQRYDWLYKFVLCSNRAGLDAIGTFTTAASCLKVRHLAAINMTLTQERT
jgi:hypothetical protein